MQCSATNAGARLNTTLMIACLLLLVSKLVILTHAKFCLHGNVAHAGKSLFCCHKSHF